MKGLLRMPTKTKAQSTTTHTKGVLVNVRVESRERDMIKRAANSVGTDASKLLRRVFYHAIGQHDPIVDGWMKTFRKMDWEVDFPKFGPDSLSLHA